MPWEENDHGLRCGGISFTLLCYIDGANLHPLSGPSNGIVEQAHGGERDQYPIAVSASPQHGPAQVGGISWST